MVKKFSAMLMLLIIVFTTAACSNEISGALNWKIEDFEVTSHTGEKITQEDLKGTVTVSNFIFTNCNTVCPPMTMNIKRLQEMVNDNDLGDKVNFLSFSVDPTVDTPEVLEQYVAKMEVDITNWKFVTGYSQQFIEDFAKNNYKTIVMKPDGTDQVIHGTKFYLIGKDWKILKEYEGVSDAPYEEIVEDIKIAAKEK